MKARGVIVLLILCLLMGGLVFALDRITADDNQAEVKTLVALTEDQIDTIEMVKGEEVVELSRKDEVWTLTQPMVYMANGVNVATVLQKLENIESDNIISDMEEKQASFEVDDASGIKVTVSGEGQQRAQFYVGKITSDFNHTYMRMADSNQIQIAKTNLNTAFWRTVDEWRDKTIVDQDQTQLEMVVLSKGATSYTMIPDEAGSWSVKSKQAQLDQDIVSSLLTSMTKMNAVGFVDDLIEAGIADLDFTKPKRQVELTMVGGTTVTVALLRQGESYYAQVAGADQVFEISSYVFESVGTPWQDLKLVAEPAVDSVEEPML